VPVANLGSIHLTYEISGDPAGPAIILIRGAGSQLVHWHPALLKLLHDCGLKVVRFDNRDAGRSTHYEHLGATPIGELIRQSLSGEPIKAPYTLHDMADDVIGLMDALGIRRAHLLGISLGAMTAQLVAARHPDRVLSLISTMSSPRAPDVRQMAPQLMQLMMRGPEGTDDAALRRHALELARTFAGDLFPLDDAAYLEAYDSARERGHPPNGEARQIAAMLATGDRSEACRQIRVPALVIHGSNDPTLPAAEARLTAELIPGARLHILEGMGHDLTPSVIEALAPLLRAHFASVS
jgi:pimeloyl-ACP methyl ester carboxylesterase